MCSHEVYRKQHHTVLRDWSMQRMGLEVRVQSAVAEYERKLVCRRERQRARDKQAQLCLTLHAKVTLKIRACRMVQW